MSELRTYVCQLLVLLGFLLLPAASVYAKSERSAPPADLELWVESYLDYMQNQRLSELVRYGHPEDLTQMRLLMDSMLSRMGEERDAFVEAVFGQPLSDDQLAATPDDRFMRAVMEFGMLPDYREDFGLSAMKLAVVDLEERDAEAEVVIAVWDAEVGSKRTASTYTLKLVRVGSSWHLSQRMTAEKVARALRGFDLRSQIGQVFSAVTNLKRSLARFAQANLRYPNADELRDPAFSLVAAEDACGICTVTLAADTGTIQTRLEDSAMREIRGQRIRFTPTPLPMREQNAVFGFRCESDVVANYLPRACKAVPQLP